MKGLFGRVKTSGFGAVGNLESAFRDYGNFGVHFACVELGILAHEKLSVYIRGFGELRWLSCVWWNLGRVRWLYCGVWWWVL